jgi:hypothetical protein
MNGEKIIHMLKTIRTERKEEREMRPQKNLQKAWKMREMQKNVERQ